MNHKYSPGIQTSSLILRAHECSICQFTFFYLSNHLNTSISNKLRCYFNGIHFLLQNAPFFIKLTLSFLLFRMISNYRPMYILSVP